MKKTSVSGSIFNFFLQNVWFSVKIIIMLTIFTLTPCLKAVAEEEGQ